MSLAVKGGPIAEHAEREADELAPEVERLRTEYQRLSRDAALVRSELAQLAETLRFGATSDDALETDILVWWQETDAACKRATFATIFDRIKVGADYIGLAFRYGFPPVLIRLPFEKHKRDDASPYYREVAGFGAPDPTRGTSVGNSDALRA